MPAGGAVEQLFKPLVGRPRPRGVNMGFPSGHVTAAATFAVLLFYVLSRERASPGVRLGLGALAVALVILVGFARVILNAHWPSDVLGGMRRAPGGTAPARPRPAAPSRWMPRCVPSWSWRTSTSTTARARSSNAST
jgi:hypothetical protein